MSEDEEGFKYPEIDLGKCTDCGVCVAVCPVLRIVSSKISPSEVENPFFGRRDPLAVYAVVNTDEEIRMQSSSGGFFSVLAQQIFRDGGVVFGSGWSDDWRVIHKTASNEEELSDLRGSKYVQSDLQDVFRKVREVLRTNCKVLFSGTPCQVAGLRAYLSACGWSFDSDRLFLVDLICHAVPSPKVFRLYLEELKQKYCSGIRRIAFRKKNTGWKRYSMSVEFANSAEYCKFFDDDAFMRVFLGELCARPSCHSCSFRMGRSHSDITLADYWNVHRRFPEMDDDKGTSLLLVNSAAAKVVTERFFSASHSHLNFRLSELEDVRLFNPSFFLSSSPHPQRRLFLSEYFSARYSLGVLAEKFLRRSLFRRTCSFALRPIRYIIRLFVDL